MGKKNYEYGSFSGGAWWMCCHDAADREWFIRHDDL